MYCLTEQETNWLTSIRSKCYNKIQESEKYSNYCKNPYNILRWIYAYEGDEELASKKLSRHLRIREILDLDNIECFDEFDGIDDEADNYAPWNILGRISDDDPRILIIEQSGKFDLQKMMKSIRITPFMLNRFKNMEKVLKIMNNEEKNTGKMTSAFLIIDLEGLNFQSNLISFISGPYRILWGTLIEQYPYLISQILIVNTPTFMSVLWNACSAFIPSEYREKIKLLGNEWKTEITKYLPESALPEQYSGTRSSSIIKEPIPCNIPIPKAELSFDQMLLDTVIIPAGGHVIHIYSLNENDEIEFFMKHENEFTMNIFYDEEQKKIQNVNEEIEDMIEMYAGCERPGINTLDYWKWKIPKTGYYYCIYGNEKAWIMSVNFKYQIFKNYNGLKIKLNPTV